MLEFIGFFVFILIEFMLLYFNKVYDSQMEVVFCKKTEKHFPYAKLYFYTESESLFQRLKLLW